MHLDHVQLYRVPIVMTSDIHTSRQNHLSIGLGDILSSTNFKLYASRDNIATAFSEDNLPYVRSDKNYYVTPPFGGFKIRRYSALPLGSLGINASSGVDQPERIAVIRITVDVKRER